MSRVCSHTGEWVETADPSPDRRDDRLMYYKCLDCGDHFPLIGDTDAWEPKLIVTISRGESQLISSALGRWQNPGVRELLEKTKFPAAEV